MNLDSLHYDLDTTSVDICSLTRSELEKFCKNIGESPFRGRQLFRWLWKPFIDQFSQMTDISKNLRDRLNTISYIYRLYPEKILSSIDGTVKFAWRLIDHSIVESVFIPDGKRKTVCLSTQVGCKMGCKFCNTARMGFIRDLSASEICLQVLSIMRWLSIERPDELPITNIVFMGMGEPLLNYDNLIKAIDILTDDLGLNFSTRRITVSTCGIVPRIKQLGRDSKVKLAISLHAPDNETRSLLMPINRRYPLEVLMDMLKSYPVSPRNRITFEYLLISGINDSIKHARMLTDLLKDIKCKVNLIPYNKIDKNDIFNSPPLDQVLAFQEILLKKNYTAIIRKSRGQDIDAACGQLFVSLTDINEKDKSGKIFPQ